MVTKNAIDSGIPIEVAKGGTGVTSLPNFSAYKSAPTLNVTGNATGYNYVCDTELFDSGAGYDNGTGVYTAPIAGKYFFGTRVLVQGCTIAAACQLSFVTTSATFNSVLGRAASAIDFAFQLTQLTTMAAGDTCYPRLVVSGEAAATDDLYGGASPYWTTFYGFYVGP